MLPATVTATCAGTIAASGAAATLEQRVTLACTAKDALPPRASAQDSNKSQWFLRDHFDRGHGSREPV